jgi:uncharacterized protein (DUF1697 family)
MKQYIAFLRGINLGNRRIKMDRLRSLFTEMGFADVSTFIASGNVIFDSKEDDAVILEAEIQSDLEQALGYGVDVFVRSRAEVATIASSQPFPKAEMQNEGYTVNVILFKSPVARDVARKLESFRTDVDAFQVKGREIFWLCQIKMSESTVWTLPEVKALKFPTSSMRNIKTLRKLAEIYAPRIDASPPRAGKRMVKSKKS